MPYQYFEVDPGFKDDKWIKASEGQRESLGVHHMIVFVQPPAAGRCPRQAVSAANLGRRCARLTAHDFGGW